MNKIYIAALIFFTSSLSGYDFYGKHFIASYRKCESSRLKDIHYLLMAFEGAVTSSGANIIDCCHHEFDGSGFTLLFLLSESHASIHTYPEHGACFVDLFTCGEQCDWIPFFEILKAYLNPKEIEFEVIPRR